MIKSFLFYIFFKCLGRLEDDQLLVYFVKTEKEVVDLLFYDSDSDSEFKGCN